MNIYYANIDDDEELGLTAVSFVSNPAVEKLFVCFEDQSSLRTEPFMFKDDLKHCITGVALRANKPIYRLSKNGDPYYIVFTPEVIEKLVERFSENNLNNQVDLQHDGRMINNVVMVESYIKNPEKGIDPIQFKDVENGSWMVTYKINDSKLWNEITTTNNFKGFSVECFVDLTTEPNEDLTNDYL